MEGFTYQNIFDTKGIEYIAILVFFALLIPFWLVLNRKSVSGKKVSQLIEGLTYLGLRIPKGIFHSINHCYAYLEKSGYASLGADNLLLHFTGEVEFSALKGNGEFLQKGEAFAILRQGDKQIHLRSSVSGKIHMINELLTENPSLINEDPYGKGWMIKVLPHDWIGDTSGYYYGNGTVQFIENEISRFREFLSMNTFNQSMPVLMDGGVLKDQALREFSPSVWHEFEITFLAQTEEK
jgi:glycine cleavage system H protein